MSRVLRQDSSGVEDATSVVTATRALTRSRVVVHDFSGHPFQVQLARSLATRGNEVTHLYCTSFLTPHGDLTSTMDNFESVGVTLRHPFSKYSWARRFVQELEYGWRVSRTILGRRPEVVVSANTPLLAAFVLQVALRVRRIPVVFWQQDVYSTAIAGHLRRRRGKVGALFGDLLIGLERWLVRSSEKVVVISDDFVDNSLAWGVERCRIHVIENWAPLDELPLRPRPNQWSERLGIAETDIVFLYAGTLGLKHEPSVLLELARAVRDRPEVRVIVASEGLGARWLADHAEPEDRLDLLPFQPYDDLPDMLGSADVLMVLLEPDAGTFSVPSKVLSYHCAGRAILGAMPAENLASRNMVAAGSGVVVAPGDATGFVDAARRLADDESHRDQLGHRARCVAERTYDIDRITDEFEEIIGDARRR